MSVNHRILKASPKQVEQVLRDGWNYADWVVGAVHIRAVDPGWPAAGSRVHHRVGAWPLTLNDNTEVISYEPGRSLELRARLRPFGVARVRLEWEPASGGYCHVRMEEEFVGGPALTLRNKVADVVLHARNAESLSRLEHLTRRYSDEAGA
jgi:hypothetical protein